MIENLLRNAVEYGAGGTLHIRQKQDALLLTVSDTGPGIAEQDRERLLAPFERGEEFRNRQTGGVGLGLSIVREFAMRQGGRFALHESPEGGVRAELRLPIADFRSPLARFAFLNLQPQEELFLGGEFFGRSKDVGSRLIKGR
ncbi:ATP-binding protein [Qipengyuania citrea]|uniref:histidine kinase n=1 Tax=Qipengyuania citrea TaxID=225971 RepID=A0ABY4U6I4_9SPHN|nr:ATP-binding protein [Qipengyuania citrea]USA61716.1 ATP-binding protein [Qipengyuania citrea]